MSNENHNVLLNSTQLLFELQKINQLNQSLSGCLKPEEIAKIITDGLINKFNCSFTRIWLVEPDRTELRLVASSGMYTRLNGDFARVPMGAYKVGKIAQYCIPFLSNSLADESWVKDRKWAIANNICGFAGLPLAIENCAIGVLAVFSHQSMKGEFLEALRMLCSSVAVALNNAQLYQQQTKKHFSSLTASLLLNNSLSEQISAILTNVNLILVGTERPLATSVNYFLLRIAEIIKAYNCNYFRLTYENDALNLEIMLVKELDSILEIKKTFRNLILTIQSLAGNLQIDVINHDLVQIKLLIPYALENQNNIQISPREQEIMQLLTQGLRDREIAEKLFISDRTVKFHVNNVVSKVQARTRIEAIYKLYSISPISHTFKH